MDLTKLRPWEADSFLRGEEDYERGKLLSQCPFVDWRERFWIEGWQRARYRFIQKTETFRKQKLKNAWTAAREWAERRRGQLRREAEAEASEKVQREFRKASSKKSTKGSYALVEVKWTNKGPGEGRGHSKQSFDKLQVQTRAGRDKIGEMRKFDHSFREWLSGAPLTKENE